MDPNVNRLAVTLVVAVYLSLVCHTTADHEGSIALCPDKKFLKQGFYCASYCGPGYFGHLPSKTCRKCAISCKTCLDSERNDICSSCYPPRYLKDNSCLLNCGDSLAKNPPSQRIRLVGGSSHFEGRVEVFYNGRWGTVCDDGWNLNDAHVVCRELLLGEARQAVRHGGMGEGLDAQPIWLSSVKCKGNENRLEECKHLGWGSHSCGHFEDAGVRCKGPDTSRECVDICGHGYYLKKSKRHCGACSDNCFTCVDSPTTCTSCDPWNFLKDQKCVTSCGEGMYGDTATRKCKSCAPGCRTCANGKSPDSCTSCPDDRYLNGTQCVVSCAPLLVAQRRRIRLAGNNRTTDLEGRVEVFLDGTWKTVCDKSFDFREATVACRQLGLGTALRAVKKGYYGSARGQIWTSMINCTGRELSLFSCPYGASSSHFIPCFHSMDVGVVCTGPRKGPPRSSRCLQKCNPGWYKNDYDVCDLCAPQCLECTGTSHRCTNCSSPRFVRNNTCVEKCADDEYGHLPSRTCRKCNAEKCVTCADGPSGDNCKSCRPPKALKDSKCESNCGLTLFKKQGICVEDCGRSFYAHTNRSCLPCPTKCIECQNELTCSVCMPPLVLENNKCMQSCPDDRFAVPVNVTDEPSTMVRLSNGSDPLEGVLEVKHNGVWGTVCDDGWDKREGDVVCRELKLGTVVQDASLTHIKKRSGKLWLDDVFCIGNEKSLLDCRHRPWGETNCNHEENTVLRCSGPGIRQCKVDCSEHQYKKGNECFLCSKVCDKCSGAPDRCITCNKGYHKKNATCVEDCGSGYYLDGSCKACDQHCGECVGKSDNCTSCKKPKYKHGNTCVDDCSPNFNPPINAPIVLRGGKTSYEGRVEVYHNGEYGTVCDDAWDLKDAQVVCRMLGMGNATEAVSRAKFGRGTGRVWMDDVNCKGNETSLFACPFRGWGRENCDHSEDAGVVCQKAGNWGNCIKTCDLNNGSFVVGTTKKSCVKCSTNCKTCAGNPDNCTTCPPQMFLNSTKNMSNCVATCKERFFPDTVSRSCSPCNSSCFDCAIVPDNCTSCNKGLKLRGSKCVPECTPNEKLLTGVDGIRLVGANSMLEGRVEIFYRGEWGTICDDSFDIDDANVVCRQLKIGKAVEARNRGKYGQGTGKIWMDDLQCTGYERNLMDCRMHIGGLGSHNCRHTEDAGVKCSGPDMSQKCVSTCRIGYFAAGQKCEQCALTCKTCSGKPDSCQSCDPPYFFSSSNCVTKCSPGYYGNTKDRVCQKCESVCQTCSDGETGHQCQSCPKGLFLNGTSCVKDCGELSSVSSLFPRKSSMPLVRLVDGKGKQEGRVEVFHDGVWGTVCDDDWDVKEASVVCKELGFGYALEAPKQSKFGKGEGIIWMDNVNCLGYESSITQCRHVGWGQGNCDPDHFEDAGVVCSNTTLEDLSNNYCREVNNGSCANLQVCDSHAEVTCVNLEMFNEVGEEKSVCLQCPTGYTGDGKQCRVVASEPPVFDRTPINYTEVTLQDTVSLNCSSQPPVVLPSVWDWKKDGKPLSASDVSSKRITSSSGELIIRSAQVDDSGNYTCTLVNSAGSNISHIATVVVKAFPQIPGVISANVAKGETATLACLVSSLPAANITWKFQGRNISVKSDKRYTFFNSNYTLQIKNVYFTDYGDYECEVSNELGGAVASARLTVAIRIQYANFQERVVAKEGADVNLTCEVNAFPEPKTTWKKDGSLVALDARHKLVSKSTSRGRLTSITVLGVKRNDMGRYACIATNGEIIQAKITRLVLTGPPMIDIPPGNMSVVSGANVSFSCVGIGDPDPSLSWLKDSEAITTSNTKKIDQDTGDLSLYSVTVRDGGRYTCVFKNQHGEAKVTAVLMVDGKTGLGNPKSRAQKSKGLSRGGLVGIVVVSLLVVFVVLAVVIYKYRRRLSYSRGDQLMDGEPTRFSDLKRRVQSTFGRSYDSPYQPQTE